MDRGSLAHDGGWVHASPSKGGCFEGNFKVEREGFKVERGVKGRKGAVMWAPGGREKCEGRRGGGGGLR